ncbi:putative DNA repair protein [Leishmania major strain Friedlin]|uniref:Putative DNA repair protein n=1 Tax=Leishmania major TaxID=5664 RepID=Q4QIF5_LEIMA|nr:putative DNA repair protein [Leishmania major strain Friedlin]CAG9569312.1 DNA_repair_protein_-_putative [Leishmania major strain Friedlin]CAJ02193.1 putative DNA repair protein [Leishmania major strain Friedlin]|eukprot:XP_001681043.1 putative DNA repair protein [Leishmania major strain Friedlin]
MSVEENVTSAVADTFRTCSEFIGAVSAREMPDNPSVQLCILSIGFDVESVIAQLLHQRMARNKPHRRVYCVVVPGRLLPGVMTRFASAIEHHLALRHAGETLPRQADASAAAASRPAPPIPVVAVEEGTGAKERCAVFQRGTVVVLTSRSLCADLLHRRLAVELVGMAVLALPHSLLGSGRQEDALAPQTAFCAELLLRSGSGAAGGQRPPPIVLVSDAPALMQSLVQRHHLGAERFVQQMHVGDVQLFPRFRLELVRHFEELSHTPRRSLTVDRVVAPVSASVLALDDLLAKIVLETLHELQRLEQQLHMQNSASGGDRAAGASAAGGSHPHTWPFPARCAAAAAEADEDTGALRFLPRSRLTASTVNGHFDYSGYPRSNTARGTGAPSYIRHGWRAATQRDAKGILFSGISETAALSVNVSDLDGDLRAVVRCHESHWPYRLLTESLIDVRRLRRAARGTAYTFLLELESVLERRLPRRSVYGTGTTPPAALWTLSSHFHDVVTVATHRIGTVVYKRSAASVALSAPTEGAATRPASSAEDGVVVVDSSSDSEEEREGLQDVVSISAAAAPPGQVATSAGGTMVPQLIPNAEEYETDVEVVVRLVVSWCRTVLRRAARKSNAATDASADRPTLLLLTLGTNAVARYTERLTNSLEAYQQLQLRRFMRVYQFKYGVELTELVEAHSAEAAASKLATELFTSAEDVDDASSDAEGDVATDEDSGTDSRRDSSAAASLRRHVSSRGDRATAATRRDASPLYADGVGGSQGVMMNTGAGAFHDALLSQLPPLIATNGERADVRCDSEPRPAPPAPLATPLLMLERVREGVVTLCPDCRDANGNGSATATAPFERMPRVLVFDASAMSATEMTMLLDGSHAALQLDAPSTAAPLMSGAPTNGAQGTDSVRACLRVERVVLARQELVLLRQLEMAQDELPAVRLATIKVQLVTTSLAELDFKKAVEAEQQAFQSLAHTKATLTGTLLVDQTSLRQTEEALESGTQVGRSRPGSRKGTAVGRLAGTLLYAPALPPPALPRIVFDEREFRSSLPYHLYRRGMELIPLTLTTADYVLSPEYAVERKSAQDYFQSVMSGRIQRQLAALARKYAHPLCLIEFHRGIPFRLMQSGVYAKTAALMAAYPRVRLVWARSPAHAAGMLVLLKKSVAVANVDPADPLLTGTSIDPGSAADVGGAAVTAAERETAHYAARVLSKFPGITHQNAPRVMQLCGSLIGLATISQASLVAVMGEEDAARLYNFLHSPFH